jgi:hypothetical protein
LSLPLSLFPLSSYNVDVVAAVTVGLRWMLPAHPSCAAGCISTMLDLFLLFLELFVLLASRAGLGLDDCYGLRINPRRRVIRILSRRGFLLFSSLAVNALRRACCVLDFRSSPRSAEQNPLLIQAKRKAEAFY